MCRTSATCPNNGCHPERSRKAAQSKDLRFPSTRTNVRVPKGATGHFAGSTWAPPRKLSRKQQTDLTLRSTQEASALKIKAEILSAILEHVRAKGYSQAQLVDILDEYQPSVSNLLKGRVSQVSIEKLLRYADRLHLQTSIAIRALGTKPRRTKTSAA
jgi:predicted XRE-type DNA-binding protein